MNLNFYYCECGCKCHFAQSKGISYSIFNDLKGRYYLYRGHGRSISVPMGFFSSFKAAEEKAQHDWDSK